MKFVLSAAALSLVAITPASAMSPASAAKQLSTGHSALVHVDYKRDRRHHNWRKWRKRRSHHHHRYEPGSHHRSAPHGWHRYHKRPGDWRTRGCIVVGPVWFCP
jgi:hypothetical protein